MKKSVLLSLLLSLSGSAFGIEIQTDQWTYQASGVPPQIHSTLRMIDSGIFLGMTSQVKEFPSASNVGEFFNKSIEVSSAQNGALDRERVRLLGIFEGLLGSESSSSSSQGPEAASTSHEVSPLIFNREGFKKCATENLKTLKMLLRVNQLRGVDGSDEQVALRIQLESEIRRQRGNGNSVGEAGVACGSHLGRAGFESSGLLEDVKILSGLLARTGDEARLLEQVTVVAFHDRSTPEVKRLWRKYWEYLAPKAVLGKQALPTLEELKVLFSQPSSGGGTEVPREVVDLLTQAGVGLAQEVLQ